MSDIAYSNQEEMFVIAEDTAGVLKKPTVSDRMYSVGPADFSQNQEFLDDEQIRATASRLSAITGRMMPGEFSFNTYVKPSGTVGTAPEHAALFKALMGAEDVSGSKVDYTLESILPSISVWVKKGHTVSALRGSTIGGADFAVSGDAVASIGWSGNYMREHRAGTAYTISIAGAVLTMTPSGAERFSEGAYVDVGTDDNGTAGFKILSINPTAGTITLNASPSVSGAQLVTPWWPSAGAEVGAPQHGKMGIVTIESQEAVILSATVSMVNNIKYYIDEKNNKLTAESYGRPGLREIDGNLTLYFIRSGPSYWYRAEYQISNELVIPVGKIAGKIMELHFPYAEYRTPTISGDEEFQQSIPFIAVADSGNDEFFIRFK